MRRLAWGGLTVLALAVGAWGLLRSPFAEQDRCLDAGGTWRQGRCEGARVP